MQPCEAWPRGPLALTPEFRSLINTSAACNCTLAPGPVLGDAGDPEVSQTQFLPTKTEKTEEGSHVIRSKKKVAAGPWQGQRSRQEPAWGVTELDLCRRAGCQVERSKDRAGEGVTCVRDA